MKSRANSMKDILLVDDEANFLSSLADGLKSIYGRKCNVFTAQNGRMAVEMLKAVVVDIVVTDLRMPEMDGFELISYLKKHHPDISVIVMTAFSDRGVDSLKRNHFVKHVAEKPIDLKDIASRIIAA
jgi:DNA-binding NtrC family response regulator